MQDAGYRPEAYDLPTGAMPAEGFISTLDFFYGWPGQVYRYTHSSQPVDLPKCTVDLAKCTVDLAE